MLEFREFDKMDSTAWAGAQNFMGVNRKPLIAHMKIDGKEAYVILSGVAAGFGEFLEIHTFDPDICWTPAYVQHGMIITQLKQEMTSEELHKLCIFDERI